MNRCDAAHSLWLRAAVISCTLLFVFSGCIGALQAAEALRVEVPLAVPIPYLEARAAEALELDAQGVGELVGDACNRLQLSDLNLRAAERAADPDDDSPPLLQMDVAVRAFGGAKLFGRCRGPGPIDGRVFLNLQPRVHESGRAVLFDASSVEFRREDGGESILTRPSRILADSLLVPRLQNMRVDVGNTLAQIDTLLERFLGGADTDPSRFAERGRLSGIRMGESALHVSLALALLPMPEAPALPIDGPAATVSALSDEELLEWRRIEDELDGFITVIVQDLASRTEDRELQLELMALLIDVRQRVAELLASDERFADDPLRALFLHSWATLSEIVLQLPAVDTGIDSGLRLAAFMAAGDALELIDALGPAYGIEMSRDGLRRMARLLLAEGAPAAFTPLPLDVNPQLQRLFRIGTGAPSSREAAMQNPVSWLRRLLPIASAHADEGDPASLLRRLFPRRDNLDHYLGTVAQLIEQTLDSHWENSRMPEEHRVRFEPLVRATAWKETCWRHYLPGEGSEAEGVRVIRSGVGAVGMMQIVGRVWRSLFDLNRLETEVTYNLASGIEILEHYYLDYALRRGEDRQPGGADNLVRATYAAYNAGPSRLNRYRRDDVSPRARAVDEQFYRHYQVMVEAIYPLESPCYRR